MPAHFLLPQKLRQASALAASFALGATMLTGLAGLSVPAQAQPAKTTASPGSTSIGDSLFPTIGNGGYNVKHYSITLNYAKSGSIRASTTIRAKASKRLSRFSLDLEGLVVKRVRVDGHRAAFTRDVKSNKLIITPRGPVSGTFSTTVVYGGKPVTHIDPDGAFDGWIPTKDGATVLSEPVGAMTWFPNNNTPRDKATYRIAVKVPAALEVAASGDLSSRKRSGKNRTWVWKQSRPMATYLTMISIGNYDVYRSSMTLESGRTLPIWNFIEPKLGTLAHERSMVPRAIRFGEKHFGTYPFGSAGIVVKDLGVGYALETQNRPVFDGAADDLTIVHEVAHQWYGDSVTPRDWMDIWLNEGFASYAESWWTETHGGLGRADALYKTYRANPPSSSLWSPAPAAFTDPADLFGAPVYTRGGMTLEALRQTIGNRDFTTLMKRWANQHRGGTVTTKQFIKLSERISGDDLGTFFDEWLYQADRPPLS